MYFFVTFSIFLSDHFDMDSRDFKKQSKRKRKLTQNLEHWHQIFLPLTLERTTKKFHFLLFFPFFFFFSRIKENRASLHRKFSYCHLKQSQQTKTYLGFTTRYFFCLFVYKDRIKFDQWRTMQHFMDNKGFSV